MFVPPVTPITQTRPLTWPRYNSSSTAPALDSLSPVAGDTAHTQHLNDTLSPPLTCSSPHGEVLQTPFVLQSARPPLHYYSSPAVPTNGMTVFPHTPSPSSVYGINGGLIVQEPQGMIQSTPNSCQPLISHNDVFSTLPKNQRPVLRPSFSHNAAYHTPSPAMWPKRMTTVSSMQESTSVQRSRPTTASTIHDGSTFASSITDPGLRMSVPDQAQGSAPGGEHEVPVPSSFPTLTSAPTPTAAIPITQSSQAPSFSAATHSLPTYSDDLSFHTSSYATTAVGTPYDSPYQSSSWGNDQHASIEFHPNHPAGYHYYHPYPMSHLQSVKQEEPILAPGEMPAPRPQRSYVALIGEALLLAPPPHQLYVTEISDYIKKRYAYYRQNPSKIYNGVRHQTSMCKAFVKLPRPFGDQSGGARKWAIRAGCETWFHSGGYYPPGSSPTPSTTSLKPKAGVGKAKTTARTKQLAIGVASPPVSKLRDTSLASPGPSTGPAWDGHHRPGPGSAYPTPQSQFGQSTILSPQFTAHSVQSHSYPPPPGYLPPGYHYVPYNPQNPHNTHPGGMFAVPVWSTSTPYGMPSVPRQGGQERPEQQGQHQPWRAQEVYDERSGRESEGSMGSYEEKRYSPESEKRGGEGSPEQS